MRLNYNIILIWHLLLLHLSEWEITTNTCTPCNICVCWETAASYHHHTYDRKLNWQTRHTMRFCTYHNYFSIHTRVIAVFTLLWTSSLPDRIRCQERKIGVTRIATNNTNPATKEKLREQFTVDVSGVPRSHKHLQDSNSSYVMSNVNIQGARYDTCTTHDDGNYGSMIMKDAQH